ncbi:MAG: cytidylate kinase-like family protein [Phycisphaerales bacterium]|nr:cytidylate kinase-like family protein [Phycisphaerales bacterium]
MSAKLSTNRELGHLIEKQMRNWEIARSQRTEHSARPARQEVEHFISISRAVGLPGNEIASLLHDRLGWPVFDREILHTMAGDDTYRERIYGELDEHDEGWLQEFTRSLTQGRFISREEYFRSLMETVVALARQGHVIFLGRATDMILPKDIGLRVRLTASRDYCVHRFAEQNHLHYEAAVRQIEEIEHERARFLRSHFHVEASEQTRHDLIINFERFNREQTADMIMSALKIRGIVT